AHQLRQRFDGMVDSCVSRLQDDPVLQARGEQLKRDLLDHPALGTYVNRLWSELLAWLQADMGQEDSAIRHHIAQAARTLGERLAGDAAVRAWINEELQAQAPRLIERYRE